VSSFTIARLLHPAAWLGDTAEVRRLLASDSALGPLPTNLLVCALEGAVPLDTGGVEALYRRAYAQAATAEERKVTALIWSRAWGQRRRLLGQNDLALYQFKIAKEDRRETPAEYRMADFLKIMGQFNPAIWGHWRPWAALTLLGYQGVRTNAARHLQWDDVDFDAGVLTWRAKYDKLGREWHQPLRDPTRYALMVCRDWRARAQYHGPWVLFSEDARKLAKDHEPIYGASALAAALKKAEEYAGVSHIELRAMHGLRRMVVGEIVRLTGDIAAAAQFIGDTDLRVVNRSYLKRRLDQLQAVAGRLDSEHAPARKASKRNLVGWWCF
jgi:integrase